jgi:hypothetical protein
MWSAWCRYSLPATREGVSSVPTPTLGLGRFRLKQEIHNDHTRVDRKQPPMTSLDLRADIYDPKTFAAMDQAFAAVWHMVRSDKPFRNYANDTELKIAIGKKLLNLVVGGVTDPLRLRNLTVESLLLSRARHTRQSAKGHARHDTRTGANEMSGSG